MGRLWLFLFLADVALTAAALISCLATEQGRIRALPRVVWIIIILLFSPVGAIAWFVAGREPAARPSTGRPGSGFPETQRPNRSMAPDDDPEFLRKLAREQSESQAADRDMLRKWEEDLRRREEDLRKKDKPDD